MALTVYAVVKPVSSEQELNQYVVAYDTDLVPWLFEHWGEPMASLVAPEPSSRIVDLASGSGLVVRHLLGRLADHGTIHGIDLDEAMVTYAAATIQDPRVSWHEADAAHLPFENNAVDRVSCHQGLQFFPDRLAVLAEAHRVLKPGGRLAVATWGRLEDNPWPAALQEAFGRLHGQDAAAAMSVVCDLGDPDEVAELFLNAGFEEIAVDERRQTVTHAEANAAAASQLAALPSGPDAYDLGPDQKAQLVEVMCGLLSDHIDTTGRLTISSTSNFACGVSP